MNLALQNVFLILIGIFVLVSVVSLIFVYRDKIINFFSSFFFKEEEKYCYTKYIESEKEINLDFLCEKCKEIGKKVKNNCICFVVYANYSSIKYEKCNLNCNLDLNKNKIWIIKYFFVEDNSFILC